MFNRDATVQRMIDFSTFLENLIKGENPDKLEYVIYNRRINRMFEPKEIEKEVLVQAILNHNPHQPREVNTRPLIPYYDEKFYEKIPEVVFNCLSSPLNTSNEFILHWDDKLFQQMVHDMNIGYVDAMYLFKGLHVTFTKNQVLIELIEEGKDMMTKAIH